MRCLFKKFVLQGRIYVSMHHYIKRVSTMYKNQRLSLVCLLFLSVSIINTAWCYMNVEAVRQRQQVGFLGKFGFDISGDKGNTETLTAKASTLNDYKTEKNEILLFGEYEYGESFEEKIAHWGNLHLRYARSLTSLFTFETFIQGEFNKFTRTNSRFLTGAGIRHKIWKRAKTSLFLGTGAYYERENIEAGGIERTSRVNLYLSYLMRLNKMAKASLITYYQPSFEHASDYWLSVETGIDLKINKILSVGMDIKYFHDNLPPSRVKRDDVSYHSGVAIKY